MPLIHHGPLAVDLADEGSGPTVVLIHSSVSGNRQWRALTETLRERYRVLAPNLYGYGETTPWPAHAQQSLHAQAQLVLAACAQAEGPVHLVGHSFGAAVALKAAGLLGGRVRGLVLLEPNLAWLLRQTGRRAAYQEALALRDHVKTYGALGDWAAAAARFADYWLGEGAWAAMPEKRRAAFVQSLPPNLHEWDAVQYEESTLEDCMALRARTLVMSDPATRLPIRACVDLLAHACPHWAFQEIEGGHMAPLTRPEIVNPLVRDFLHSLG